MSRRSRRALFSYNHSDAYVLTVLDQIARFDLEFGFAALPPSTDPVPDPAQSPTVAPLPETSTTSTTPTAPSVTSTTTPSVTSTTSAARGHVDDVHHVPALDDDGGSADHDDRDPLPTTTAVSPPPE